MRVLKFGGAALRDGPAVRHAARIVDACGGDHPLVVVSAHAGVTGQLERCVEAALAGRLDWDPLRVRHRTLLRQLDLPGDLLDRHLSELRAILETLRCSQRVGDRESDRLRDFVLSFGERMSARVFAAALRREGLQATPLDASDLGLVKAEGRLDLRGSAPDELLRVLHGVPGVPVITGFLALDAEGHLTTLGRNGSDLTAAWFGAALGAEEVQLWKRVPGLMTADPRVVPGARHLPEVSWDEAGELALHGSGVLHPSTIEPARRAGAPIHLRDLDDARGPGSRIAGAHRSIDESGGPGVRAIAHRDDIACLRVPIEPERSRTAQLSELFGALTAAGVEPYVGTLGPHAAELLLTEDRWLARLVESCVPDGVLVPGLATVTLVGAGLERDPEVEAALAEAARLGVREIHCELTVSGSSRSRVLLTSRAAVADLVRRLHGRFFGS